MFVKVWEERNAWEGSCVWVISEGSGNILMTLMAPLGGSWSWALSGWCLEWEITLLLPPDLDFHGEPAPSTHILGMFFIPGTSKRDIKQVQLCKPFEIIQLWGLSCCCFFLPIPQTATGQSSFITSVAPNCRIGKIQWQAWKCFTSLQQTTSYIDWCFFFSFSWCKILFPGGVWAVALPAGVSLCWWVLSVPPRFTRCWAWSVTSAPRPKCTPRTVTSLLRYGLFVLWVTAFKCCQGAEFCLLKPPRVFFGSVAWLCGGCEQGCVVDWSALTLIKQVLVAAFPPILGWIKSSSASLSPKMKSWVWLSLCVQQNVLQGIRRGGVGRDGAPCSTWGADVGGLFILQTAAREKC